MGTAEQVVQSAQGVFIPALVFITLALSIAGAVFGIMYKVVGFFLTRLVNKTDGQQGIVSTEIEKVHKEMKDQVQQIAGPFIKSQEKQNETLEKLNDSVTRLNVTIDHIQKDAASVDKRIDDHKTRMSEIGDRVHKYANEVAGVKTKVDVLWRKYQDDKGVKDSDG